MGDHDEGDADLVLQALELHLHGAAQLLVERAERLVEQQQARPLDQRAGERDALLLPARQLLRLAVGERRQLRRLEDRVDAGADFRGRQPLHLQPVGDVGPDRHMREQRIGLEHQIDRPLVGRDSCDVAPVEQDASFAGRLEAGQHPEQRCLAAARRPEQGEELVLADFQRHAVDGADRAEALADLVDVEQGLGFAHGATSPRLSRCDSVSAVMLTAMTMVASALISGVMPKRIIA